MGSNCVKILQMTLTMIHEEETMKQMSGGHMPRDGSARQSRQRMPQGSHYKRRRLAGPKSLKNAVSFQMESKSGPCGPGVHGPTDDADFSRRIPNRSAPHGDQLDLALVGRRFEIFPLVELSFLKSGHTAAKGSDHVVL